MSDDAGKLDEEGSNTEGGVKRAGRARICKQCRFTTTNVREFSDHRLHAHAEENPEEKVNRKTGAKRRSSSAVSVILEDTKNQIALVAEKNEEDTKTKATLNEDKVTENQKENIAVVNDNLIDNNNLEIKTTSVNDNTINKDTMNDNSKVMNEEGSVEINEEPAKQYIETETKSDLNKMDPGKEISEELLKSLALARKNPSVSIDNGKLDAEKNSIMKRPSTEKILIEKQNGMTEEVLLINREEDPDDEPRLFIADEGEGEMMDQSDLDPHSLYRTGNIQNRTYLCNICEYSTTNAKSYLHHQKDVHNPEIIIYECDICDYATKYKQKLPRHRKLHFSGKDGLSESNLDSSLTERELREMKESSSFNADFVNGEEEMDDEVDMEEDEEEEIAVSLTGASSSLVQHAVLGAPVEKKKRIRQEVDPLKYFEVMDESGVKYACSKCGNVYKWRKSLNKHWKEKHFGEVPDLTKPPPTLQNYTLFSRFKPKAGGQPPPPAAPNVVYGAAIPSPTIPQKNRTTPTSKSEDLANDLPSMVPHRQIVPFMSSSSPELYRSQFLSLATQVGNRTPENHHEMRKMMDELQRRSNALKNRKMQLSDRTSPFREKSQHEPIDYSKPIDFSKKNDIKSEPNWGDDNSESADSLQDIPISMSQANSQIALAMKQSIPSGDADNPVLQCSKCSFVAKTLVDYSAHMSLHLNKRAFKCAECQSHFNGVEELNKHFMENHSEKIQEHKEAIQKIPHGLQQTYHLLKMPLDSISNLSNQELLSNEPKQLKCSMCHFIAKWPAELQKHAVSHSEERPFVCMVCGSTYKWKWDLVKHFEKSHTSLPNPYKRREGGGVVATGSTSPATPLLESISRDASAMMESSMVGEDYIKNEETTPSKKRRFSETDFQDTEEFYRELLERQLKHRREMGQNNEFLLTPILPNRPRSAPFNKNNDIGKEDCLSLDSMDDYTSKYHVNDLLKHRIKSGKHLEEDSSRDSSKGKSDVVLPYKCSVCEYRARWPSEISQHMKNHSNEKPFHCPRCSYKSKWKWDVVKHLRRCGGGTVHDVIDTSRIKKMAPPNVMVLPQGNMQQQQIQQSQKLSPGQSIYHNNHRAKSLSPAINNLSRLSNANFSLTAGGQDHQAMMELMSQNGNFGKDMNGKQGYSLEKDGLFHCMECPFIGSSQAELKRHAVLHSENKPFLCNMCGYSSRWKCDLKKHMRVYNHFDNNTVESTDDFEISQDKFEELEDDSDDEKSTLYMCPQCPYNSYKKLAFEHHLNIHGNLITDDEENDVPQTPQHETPTSPKFKCSKCEYEGNDLSSFLQHKQTHGSQISFKADSRESVSPVRSESTPLSTATVDAPNRTVHLKHRRKPVKHFRCEKCPYICFQKSALINHDNLHQSQGNDAYLCMFCDYNVFSKNLLLQHMRLHPEYNPAEGSEHDTRVSAAELMEMEGLEEKELASDERKGFSLPEENNNTIDDYENGFDYVTGQSTQNNRASTPSSLPRTPERSPENNNLKEATNNNTSGEGLPCEWCSCTFPNVVTLYQHAQSLHPTQLKAQEAGDIAAKQAPSKASQLAQIVRERQREYQVYHQTVAHQPQFHQQQFGLKLEQMQNESGNKFVQLAPKPPMNNLSMTPRQTTSLDEEMLLTKQQIAILNARKSASQQKRGRSFQCTKCSFTAPNAVTYLRHIERHGSNCKHTCLYCDYSIDRLNLLYQHMKGTHGSKWTGTTEEKIHLSVNGEDSNNNIIDGFQYSDENMVDDLNGSFNSSNNDSLDEMSHRDSLVDFQKQLIGEMMRMPTEPVEMEDKSMSVTSMMSAYAAQMKKPILQLKGNTIFKGVMLQVCSLDGKKHYKCPRCVYVNNNAANTANHVKQHGLNKKYTCKHCDYSVDNYKHIQHHIDTVHPKEPVFVIMNSVPPTLLIDDISEDVANIKGQDSKQELPYICKKCPYQGADKEMFLIHSSRHRDNGKFECQVCDFSVDKYSVLRQHSILHSNKILSSDQAEDIEMSDNSLETNAEPNKDRDSDIIRYKCSCCPYFTVKKTDILKHRLNHISKSTLSCQLCTYSSNENEELQQHLKFHQNKQSGVGNQSQDITLDPYNDSYKLIEQVQDGNDVEMEEGDEFEDEAFEETSENTGELEDDAEVAMMEEELRETYGQIGDRVGVNLNAEGGIDTEIQFRTFKCKLCPFSSNSNSEFKKHCRLHGSSYKFRCDYCTYSLDRVNLISQHRKLHFREPEFESTPLIKSLLNKDHEDYSSMLAKVGNDIAFPPSEAGSKLIDESSEFNSFCQKTGSNDRIRYVCNKCPYRCKALKNFKCHMQMHGLIRKYKCDYCDWSAERLNLLYQHRRVHDSEPRFNPAPGDIHFLNREYILDNNGNSEKNVNYALMESVDTNSLLLSSQTKPTQHMKNSGQKSHFCKLCPFETDDINSYWYHKKLHCIQALFNCSECSYSSNNNTSLREHIKLHKNEQEILKPTLKDRGNRQKCPKCLYSSRNKTLLTNHIAMHSPGGKHTCNHCDFSCNKQRLLEIHLKVHEEEYSDSDSLEGEINQLMKYNPDVTGPQLYFSMTNLNDMDSDSNDMVDLDLKCDQCPFSTPSKDELGDHIQHHESETKSKLNCTFCTFSCSKEDELLQHAQVHFPSTKLDWDMMKHLRKQHQSYRKNLSKSFPDDGNGNKSSDDNREPDSTVQDASNSDTVSDAENNGTKDTEKTKVYVCQFCEREFNCKATMLQHENQHLVGT